MPDRLTRGGQMKTRIEGRPPNLSLDPDGLAWFVRPHKRFMPITSDPPIASKKRMLLAIYLDFLMFMVVWGLANFIAGGEAHFVVGVIVFVAIRVAPWKVGASPGQYFLSIGRDRLVDADVYHGET